MGRRWHERFGICMRDYAMSSAWIFRYCRNALQSNERVENVNAEPTDFVVLSGHRLGLKFYNEIIRSIGGHIRSNITHSKYRKYITINSTVSEHAYILPNFFSFWEL